MPFDGSRILNTASLLGIPVERGSASRAWVKAAYLFIEYYVIPAISNISVQGSSNLAEEITSNLLKYLTEHLQNANSSDGSSQSSITKSLPTRKCFISVKKLVKRFHSLSVHSHITLGNDECKCTGVSSADSLWTNVPNLLVGYIESNSTNGQMNFSDKSGSLPFHNIAIRPEYNNTVSLFVSWNYIPICEGTGYLEVTNAPFVLAQLKTSINRGVSLKIDSICGVDKIIRKLKSSTSHRNETFHISGFVYKLDNQGTFPVVKLISKEVYDKDLCVCESDLTESIDIILEEKNFWLSCFSVCDLITITNVKSLQNSSYNLQVQLCTTSNSRLSVSNDSYRLLQKYKEKTNKGSACQITFGQEQQLNYCSEFVGKISNVINDKLGILSLNDLEVTLILTYCGAFNTMGMRIGSIITIRKSHVCIINEKIIMLCCNASSINVILHSEIPTMQTCLFDFEKCNIIQRIRDEPLHPAKLLSMVTLLEKFELLSKSSGHKYISELDICILEQVFFENFIFSKCVDGGHLKGLKQHDFPCTATLSMTIDALSYVHISIEDLSKKSLKIAKEEFQSNQRFASDDWQATTISSGNFLPANGFENSWKDNVVLMGYFKPGTCGCLEVSDGICSLKCVLLQKRTDESKCSCFNKTVEKAISVICTEDLGCTFRIHDFSIVVERRSSNQNDVESSECEGDLDLHEYDVYIVICKDEISLISNSCHHEVGCDYPTNFSISEHATEDTYKPKHGTKSQRSNSCLLLVIQKAPVQSFPGQESFFNIMALKNNKSELEDCYIQLKGEASKWFSVLYPGMIVEMSYESNDTININKCTLELCHFKHIHTPSDVSIGDMQSFNILACHAAKSQFSDGIKLIYSVHDLVMCPPSGQSKLIAVCGQITNRIEYTDHSLPATETCVRINISDNRSTLSVYSGNRGHLAPGLICGAVVNFYRLKVVLSSHGHVYCKYTPSSFHIVISVKFSHLKSNEDYPGQADKSHNDVKTEKASPDKDESTFLYHLYSQPPQSMSKYKVIKLNVFMTRLLHLQLTRSDEVAFQVCQPKRRCIDPMTHAYNINGHTSKGNIGFFAKCVISDGSGKALLYFGPTNQADFCKLADIKTEEWGEILTLLHASSSGSINYDCDLHHDKLVTNVTRDLAQNIAVDLCNDVNSRPLASRMTLVRQKLIGRNRGCDGFNTKDGKSHDYSMFKIGAAPVEGAGDTSVRSMSLRLIKFNCVSVV